jgi:hypothetical protein
MSSCAGLSGAAVAVVLAVSTQASHAVTFEVIGGTFFMPLVTPSVTAIGPGNPGLLVEGTYQGSGEILASFTFFGAPFFTYTAPTGVDNPPVPHPAPSINPVTLTADMSAFYGFWGGTELNQGSSVASVTPNADATITLDWSSLVVGGPFNGLTMEWSLTLAGIPGPTVTWVGGGGSWNEPSNWSSSDVPGAAEYVSLVQSDALDRVVTYANPVAPAPVLQGLEVDATGTGTMTLAQLTDDLATQFEVVGGDGAGLHDQSGGSNTINGSLVLGQFASGDGRYALSGTGVLSAKNEVVGRAGAGTFAQGGGANTVAEALVLGAEDEGHGDYALTDGTLTADREDIGVIGSGSFVQTGGENRTGAVSVGAGGSYDLQGGSLDAVTLAVDGGRVSHGGTGRASLDRLALNAGTYELTGGALDVLQVEVDGGRFTQNGLVAVAPDSVALTGNGHYDLGAGTLDTALLRIEGGAELRQSGGSASVGTTTLAGAPTRSRTAI